MINDENVFDCHNLDNQKRSIVNPVVIEFFFNHHISTSRPIDSGLISTIDLATKFDLVMEFGLPSNKM
jgi:hypothetical protein